MNWTIEQLECHERRQLARRLDAAEKYVDYPPKFIKKETPCGTVITMVIHTAKPKTAKAQPEYKIQAAFVKEMAQMHPGVMVFSDCAAHIKKTMIQQQRANALSTPGEKWPDVFVAQPSGDYAGLWLEFKAETPYKVDGVTLKANPHNQAQWQTMQRLEAKGYMCSFVWSVAMAMEMVKAYFD